ncbi:hypothetical protein pb186bvf_014672 [Paramecium bursaria]
MYQCPAKIVISGEHSVVYGKKAICAAITLYSYMNAKVKRVGYTMIDDPVGQRILNRFPTQKQLDLSFRSDVPQAAGLGSSAAYALLISKAIGEQDILESAKQMENIFHGSTGSGMDVWCCYHGGIWQFQQHAENIKLDLDLKNIALIDSGLRKQGGTQATLRKVATQYQQDKGKQIIDKIGTITENIIKNGISLEDIYMNHKLLDELGVCPQPVNEIVENLYKLKIPCKMTGAGDGGFCIAFLEKDQQIPYEYISVDIDYDGVQ